MKIKMNVSIRIFRSCPDEKGKRMIANVVAEWPCCVRKPL